VVRHLTVLEFDCALFRKCCLDNLGLSASARSRTGSNFGLWERSSALHVDGECVMALRSGDRIFECGVLVCEYR